MAPEAASRINHLRFAASTAAALETLSPAIRHWFTQRHEWPTAAQRQAWPTIAAGEHLLLCAPTGSGKTLAAFVPILSELLAQPAQGLSCLYVAPLKALNTDVRRTLRRCVREIEKFVTRPFTRDGLPVRVGLRTGDTSARVRRRMLLHPPEILLTTPESLAVLLTQARWAAHFTALRWVVLDEVHAFAGSKRGADLSLSLERLDDIAAVPPQRIGLSATCAPVSVAAEWLVGDGRACKVAVVNESAQARLDIEPLAVSASGTAGGEGTRRNVGFVAQLVERLVPELESNRTTLVFTNSRGLAERLTWALRRRFPEWVEQVGVHHSSLAAARRRQVERRLKQGRLRVVVSSTSLELGIDIGSVDRVVLVHPPGSVVRLLQRLGRSGHRPGQLRSGLVLTANAGELLEAAVTCASSQNGQLEPLRVPDQPLDVLCQHLLGMAALRMWQPDEAFALVSRAYPYRALPRWEFDDCLAYLSGRHRDGRDWLPPRLQWDEGRFLLIDQRTARILRRNLGTILTEEPCRVRIDGGGLVGHVDDTYADQLQPGDRFLLDGRCLEYRRQSGGDIEVQEVPGRPAVPRWTSAGLPMALDLARRLYMLRTQAAEALREDPRTLATLLRQDYGLNPDAAAQLAEYFAEQEEVSEIPDARTLLIEAVAGDGMVEYALHTPLHRAGNDALTRVAVHRLARELGRSTTSLVGDLGCLLCVEGPLLQPAQWREVLAQGDFDADLESALTDSIALRERFRRAAFTGLMLLKNPLGQRRKVGGVDWAERRLFEQVRAADPDFVLLRQALREVRTECCDAEAARAFVELLPGMTVRQRCLATPSPFAQHWSQAIAGPGASALTPEEALRRLHAELTGAVDEFAVAGEQP